MITSSGSPLASVVEYVCWAFPAGALPFLPVLVFFSGAGAGAGAPAAACCAGCSPGPAAGGCGTVNVPTLKPHLAASDGDGTLAGPDGVATASNTV